LAPERGDGTGTGRRVCRPVDGPSEKQVAFLAKLAAERGVPVPECTSKRDASKAIERLLALPKVTAESTECRWTQHCGSWVVRAPGHKAGETVTVHKANGTTTEAVLVGEVAGA